MIPKNILPCIILILLSTACKRNDDKPPVPPEGCISLSELLTKHDYYLPFALENDNYGILSVKLNGTIIDFDYGGFFEFNETGFYELVLIYKDQDPENDTILFTTKTEERELSEWGIKTWIPASFETASVGTESIEVFYPRRYTDGMAVPFVFYVRESGAVKALYCRGKCTASGDNFNIKRGVGSVNIAASAISGQVGFNVGGRQLSVSPSRIQDTDMELHGTVTSDIDVPANSLVRISGDLDISSTGSLTVHEGAILIADEAVNIYANGPVLFSGTAGNPVLVTCSIENKYWGGFLTNVPSGTIEAHYTIFCQSGYHDSGDYGWGHAGRQALFYTENSTLTLDHCFITDHIGQIFYPQHSTLVLDDILVQRAKTGGQLNFTDLTLRNSVFTDFPDDSYIFRDEDNDALYLNASDAVIENTTFMFAKDDGLDSGADGGGDVTVTGCRFEACFHEGAALSSITPAVKHHTFAGCVFTNCGQGLELGYSSVNHSVIADNCMFLNNAIGIRYGDNYDWSEVDGKMSVTNSSSLYNDKDVWNMIRKTWSPKLENLSFENTTVSKFCPQYPELIIE